MLTCSNLPPAVTCAYYQLNLDVKRKRTFSYENSLHAQLARECGNINAQEESHYKRFKIQGNSLKFLSKAAFVYTVCEQNRQTVFV